MLLYTIYLFITFLFAFQNHKSSLFFFKHDNSFYIILKFDRNYIFKYSGEACRENSEYTSRYYYDYKTGSESII